MPIVEPKPKFGTFPAGNLGQLFASVGRDRKKTASDVLARLDEYSPKRAPERPVTLEKTDGELHDLMLKSERGRKISKSDHEQLRLLGNWRSAVRNVEMVSCGNLILLLGVLNTLESDDDSFEDAQRIRSFLEAKYGAHLATNPAPNVNSNWAEWWASRNAQQRDVLPLSLRTTDDAKIKPVIEQKESEDDDDDEGY